jgi:nanoRNase/pAp phosphatase (c-di-AMP/oligoRNAs hydrolase)
VTGPLAPILERHRQAIAVYERLAELKQGVVEADLSESGIESANKFIAYDLFPAARYTVIVSRDPRRTKVSVGSNPWATVPRTHDIARLCEKYGGGGHAVVGAVSLPADRIAEARRVAGEIAGALRVEPGTP